MNDSSSRRARGRPRDWSDKTEQNTIKSLDRALEALQRLAEMGGATLSELAGELDQAPATVYRMLITMEQRGVIEYDAAGQIWHIGPQAFLIGSHFLRRTSLVERARPILRALMEQTGETANLGIEKDGKVLFLSQVETHSSIRAFFPPGTISPMHASGIGKALLAQFMPDRLERYLDAHALSAFTEHTLTDRSDLIADLAHIRDRGFSIDAEERNLGMKCVAAPVFDLHGEASAGLSISGPSSRMDQVSVDDFGAKVRQAADTLTNAIGGSPHTYKLT
ncbi:HTH-type transcriptional regulator BhcR [Thalassococcus sp. S3]|uniref:HTH-type transcriptional regulator BhcR n=1 Tax=Thalassococcus sp. S3 TaxID=2017482 RepID=UPI001024679C|nr:HTH-type transcriptional regulator BhcR [Thalassococcus sp. S3]QBF30578.1 IclR family transcriptional regulator [Thalassococcus sp. S3]